MADSLIYDKSVSSGDIQEQPFLRKEMLFITDTSQSGNYSMNQVIFETSQLSNNGRWIDYANDAYFSFPMMMTATATVGGNNVALPASDFLLALKNSNYNLIHSMQVEYGNGNVIQLTNHINQYINFKLHTEMSLNDIAVNGTTIGYSKDDSSSWGYSAGASPTGRGLTNNANSNYKMSSACQFAGEPFNSGMKNRQLSYQTVNSNLDSTLTSNSLGREYIYGRPVTTSGNMAVKSCGQNYIENSIVNAVNYKCYYYDAILRLRDLPFFPKLPLVRGAYMKITLNLNQCQFQVIKDANGNLDFTTGSLNLNGGTNPLMVGASVVPLIVNDVVAGAVGGNTGAQLTALQAGTADVTLNNVFVPCGSGTIPVGTTISCSLCCGKNYMSYHSGLNLVPLKTNCRLYVPSYIMAMTYEDKYLAIGQKTINYNEIFQFPIYNIAPGQNFTNLITNGQARMKRIIICPFVSSQANGSETNPFSPLVSPFTCEPATVSPHAIQNFNLALGGINIYQQHITYGYEHFLNETSAYGINANKTTGMVSGQISQRDWSNNYGYIVCDLSRRLPEDDTTSIAVSITGLNAGAKGLDLYCYIEYEKSIVIDLLSGKKLN